MPAPNAMDHITDGLAAVTISDGAVPTKLKLGDKFSQRAHVTQLTTSLDVVWYRPHRNLWLRYASRQDAEQAMRALEGVVLGKVKVHCVLKPSVRDQDTSFAVQVCDVVDGVTWQQVRAHLPGEVQDARRHTFGEFTYPLNTNVGPAVKEEIERVTEIKVRDWCFVDTDNGLKRKAVFNFTYGDANLAAHAEQLNGSMLEGIPGLRIYVVEHLRMYLAVRVDIYDRHTKALKGIAQRAWRDHRIRVKLYDGELTITSPGGCRLLCVDGVKRKAVQAVKAEVDNCIIADIATGIQRMHQTLGGEKAQTRKIKLRTIAEYKQATQGGIKRLESYFGPDNVKFQDDTEEPSITIKSKKGQFTSAKELLPGNTSDKSTTCDICIGDDSALLTIPKCDHKVCRRCLGDYCSIDTGDKIPLRCFAAVNCDTLLPIEWLADNLPQPIFKALRARVVETHCQTNPASYVQCSGDDCSQYLSRKWHSDRVVCPSCLIVNCTSCKSVFHYGETCAEFVERTDPHNEALDRHLALAGGKRCPRCQIPSVKVEGCNHMICTGCRAHYCWVCLTECADMGATYRHLEEVHGGNGLEDQEQEEILAEAARLRQARDVFAAFIARRAQLDEVEGEIGPPGDWGIV